MRYLEPKVEQALLDMDFIGKYKKLSNKYNELRAPMDKRLKYIDVEIVKDIMSRIGYETKYDRKEKFFKTKDKKNGKYSYRCHFMLDCGKVDMMWIIYKNEKLIVADSIGMYPRFIIDYDYIIKRPAFKNYEDLEKILQTEFEMFKEFRYILFEQE